MEILISTNGNGEDTTISINGELQDNLTFFTITVRKFNKVKCQMEREFEKNGKSRKEFVSYYAGDFVKNDELYGQ